MIPTERPWTWSLCSISMTCWVGITNSLKNAGRELQSSHPLRITFLIKTESMCTTSLLNMTNVSKENKKRNQEEADMIYWQLPDRLQKAVDLAKVKGASTWFTVLPLTEQGFTLHNLPFVMRWLCVMAGHHPNFLPNVNVVTVSM